MNFLRSLMIILLNAFANPLARGCMRTRRHSEFSTYHKIDRMIGSQIKDRCHGWSFRGHQIDGDMVFDEVNNVICFNFSERYSLCPLWKVISYRKDELMTSTDGGLIGPIISTTQASNGHAVTVGWGSFGGWCIKFAWIWQFLHFLRIWLHRRS